MQHWVLDFEIAVDLRPAIPYLLMALDSQRANRILNMGFNEQHPTPLSLIRAGAIRNGPGRSSRGIVLPKRIRRNREA